MTFYFISFKGVIYKFILMPWKTLIFTWPAKELLPWPRQLIQEQAQKISSLEEKLESLQNCPFIWKISNFSSVMAAAQRNEQRVIVSEPFYSSRNGYKFALELYPDGYHTNDTLDQEKGNFMSIYLRVLVGEYDGLLLWPFQDSVMFTLLDQNYLVEKRRHLRQELQLNAEG